MFALMVFSCVRIVVSAPKRDTEGGQLKGTGAVYVCPVTPGPCQRSSFPRLYDTAGEERKGCGLENTCSKEGGGH